MIMKMVLEKMDLQEALNQLKVIYENQMPFNRLLDIRIDSLTPTDVKVRFDMREELIGNFIRQILHGGVISSVLDLTGGLIATVEMLKHMENIQFDEVKKRYINGEYPKHELVASHICRRSFASNHYATELYPTPESVALRKASSTAPPQGLVPPLIE